MRRPFALRFAVALAVAFMGCALGGCTSLGAPPPRPERPQPSSPARSPVADAQATHEYPGPHPPRESARGSGGAVQAIAQFTAAYINWDAHTVSTDMWALARESVGQARSAMELAAAQTGTDYELQRGGIANSGTVEAVAPLGGQPGRYLVVTREQTTAAATTAYQGLQPAWHVAIATVIQIRPGRWAVSGWQPES
jgi:hypothetical protein